MSCDLHGIPSKFRLNFRKSADVKTGIIPTEMTNNSSIFYPAIYEKLTENSSPNDFITVGGKNLCTIICARVVGRMSIEATVAIYFLSDIYQR